jgi:hypothetical protein
MQSLLSSAVEEWTASGGSAELIEGLMDDLSEGYKAAQATVGRDLAEELKAIGPNVFKLMAIASSELARADDAWQRLEEAEETLNRAGHAGYATFLGRPEGVTASALSEIHHSYFRHRRLFFYSLDWENKICADSIKQEQKGHTDYTEVEVDLGSLSNWMRETGRWPQDAEPVVSSKEDHPHADGEAAKDIAKIVTPVPEPQLRRWLAPYIERYMKEHGKLPSQNEGEEAAKMSFLGRHTVPRGRFRPLFKEVALSFAGGDQRFGRPGPRPPLPLRAPGDLN